MNISFKKVLRHIMDFLLTIVLIEISGFLSFYLTKFLSKKLALNFSDLGNQLIITLITYLILVAIMYCFYLVFYKKHNKVWKSITDSLKRISKGDFNVKLEVNDLRDDHEFPVNELVTSINDMAEELKLLEEMRQEFISNVSHEIQSPLTSINGFAKALKSINLSDEDRVKYLTIIEDESSRLSKISDNLMKLTTLESGQIKCDTKEFSLDKQIRKTILSFENMWSDKDIEVSLSSDKVLINADEDLLNQVWINLINNSIKFTTDGGRIDVSVEESEGKIYIKVSDTGIGLSEEEQERIFERFYKADKSRTAKKGGSGLGLSIVKKIIEIHNGKIHVESEKDVGTTFNIVLPKNI
jgi:two-component system, OmpR family, phosphate regulon sensor histidine kinase PhoR